MYVVILECGVECLVRAHSGFVLEVVFEVLNKLFPHTVLNLAKSAFVVVIILDQYGFFLIFLGFSCVIDLEYLQKCYMV